MQLLQNLYQFIFKGNQRTVKVKKNIVFSLVSRGCGMLISLILVPMTLGYLNETEYGIWLTLSSIVTWINFFDIGLGNGLRNQISRSRHKNNKILGSRICKHHCCFISIDYGKYFSYFYHH